MEISATAHLLPASSKKGQRLQTKFWFGGVLFWKGKGGLKGLPVEEGGHRGTTAGEERAEADRPDGKVSQKAGKPEGEDVKGPGAEPKKLGEKRHQEAESCPESKEGKRHQEAGNSLESQGKETSKDRKVPERPVGRGPFGAKAG